MNPDAALWLAIWFLIPGILFGLGFAIWCYLEAEKANAEYHKILEQRRLEGKMQVREIKLYSVPSNKDTK